MIPNQRILGFFVLDTYFLSFFFLNLYSNEYYEFTKEQYVEHLS